MGEQPTKSGWYDDPEGVADQACWDGQNWTGATRLRPHGSWLVRRSAASVVGTVALAIGAVILIAIPDNYDLTYLIQCLVGSALVIIGSLFLTGAFGVYARRAFVVDQAWSLRVVAPVILSLASVGWIAVAMWRS